ncbi:MBL fold metallo-hydrolase [Planococcus sp. N028]|uniref:MBL fold metallo-hydrolase n=1 Tax=Planococcus shixiaomingii TaxID=3058393 RepID=A0ABT8MY71_9BACL|nr:MBL fold metallo-hydrolase [Planococcus sp. N028]MDN7240582.1 MBL fold metallo-hydrolase [Planococcus sp. N028]
MFRPKVSKKIIKRIAKYFLVLIVVLGVVITLFINISPTFGGNPSKEQKDVYKTFENYKDGKFFYQASKNLDGKAAGSPSTLPNANSPSTETDPSVQIPVSEIDWNKINSKEDSLTWFGHSAVLLSLDNNKILIDPMLGPIASPVTFAGPKRYSEDLLGIIEKMPPIDAVFITHDHYDHLDYHSIKKLNGKVRHFFVPYGVSNHLIRWGIAKEKITELNWWDETEFQGLAIALTPSKHFSGRGVFNRRSTLWGGWVILGTQTRFYTSGDGGYDAHFKEIGDKYGPFDIALLEGGQYDKRWPESHMLPEESVQANIDVQGKHMMLMHWGAFTLARHGWAEPIERATKAAKERDVKLIAPKIGETVLLDGKLSLPVSTWWN